MFFHLLPSLAQAPHSVSRAKPGVPLQGGEVGEAVQDPWLHYKEEKEPCPAGVAT